MGIVNLITSEKGGQGKSMVCKTLADYAESKGINIALFDSDATNPDVYRTYPDKTQLALFSEGRAYEDAANSIVEAALESDAVVNCPASVFRAMQHWFDKNLILDIAEEEGFTFNIVFVSDGEPESLLMLKQNLEYFKAGVNHIILLNFGTIGVFKDETNQEKWRDKWVTFYADKVLQEQLSFYNASVFEFPELYGDSTVQNIKADNLSFLEAQETLEGVDRYRTKAFIKQAFPLIESGGFFLLNRFSFTTTHAQRE